LNAINIAIIPNPDNQKAKSGFSTSLTLPRLVSWLASSAFGIGAAVGHSAGINKVLSKNQSRNIRAEWAGDMVSVSLFLPRFWLTDLCDSSICKAKDVDNEVGISSDGRGPGHAAGPEDRMAFYKNRIARLSTVLPPLQKHGGRSEPLAMLGQTFSDRDNDRKMRRAQRKKQKGKTEKFDALEGGLQWVNR
jgi:hypothetical protein